MPVRTARRIALAYWGYSSRPGGRAPQGVSVKITGEFGTGGLAEAAAPARRFAALVERTWPDYIGNVSRYGRLPLAQLVALAREACGEEGAATVAETEAWTRRLVDEVPGFYLATAERKGETEMLLVNVRVKG